MSIKLNNIMTKADWFKIGILLVVSIICWAWVYREYQKPILPPDWNKQALAEKD